MSFFDRLRKTFGGGPAQPAATNEYWIYAQCRRCGEPLKGRVNLANDPSEDEDGTFIVRKGLVGSGERRCFQTVEVVLHFDVQKREVIDSEATGGRLVTAEEYEALRQQPAPQEDEGGDA